MDGIMVAMQPRLNPSLPSTPKYTLFTDGACAPNPGPMGIGYTLTAGQGVNDTVPAPLVRVGAQIGEGTNNEAEYRALIEGLRHALRLGMWTIECFTDSNLLVQQLGGQWKVKDKGLRLLHREAMTLLNLFSASSISHVYRENNVGADALSHTMTYEEPPLPAPKPNRALLDFQAAAIRVWWRTRTRNTYMLGRIFGISDTQVSQIGMGTAYRNADFTGLPSFTLETSPAIL